MEQLLWVSLKEWGGKEVEVPPLRGRRSWWEDDVVKERRWGVGTNPQRRRREQSLADQLQVRTPSI